MTGTGTQKQMQTWTTGVTTIALLVLRTGELKNNKHFSSVVIFYFFSPIISQVTVLSGHFLHIKASSYTECVLFFYRGVFGDTPGKIFLFLHKKGFLHNKGASNEYPHCMLSWRNSENYPRIIIKYFSSDAKVSS